MKTIRFLNSQIPAIGMGTWYMGEGQKSYEQELHALQSGIERGIQLIDTAEMYGEGLAEKLVGEAIKTFDREQLKIVSNLLQLIFHTLLINISHNYLYCFFSA